MYYNGCNVITIDDSREMISEVKRCHPELPDKLKVVNIPDDLNYKSCSVARIYSIATLMHLDKDAMDRTIDKIAIS